MIQGWRINLLKWEKQTLWEWDGVLWQTLRFRIRQRPENWMIFAIVSVVFRDVQEHYMSAAR